MTAQVYNSRRDGPMDKVLILSVAGAVDCQVEIRCQLQTFINDFQAGCNAMDQMVFFA